MVPLSMLPSLSPASAVNVFNGGDEVRSLKLTGIDPAAKRDGGVTPKLCAAAGEAAAPVGDLARTAHGVVTQPSPRVWLEGTPLVVSARGRTRTTDGDSVVGVVGEGEPSRLLLCTAPTLLSAASVLLPVRSLQHSGRLLSSWRFSSSIIVGGDGNAGRWYGTLASSKASPPPLMAMPLFLQPLPPTLPSVPTAAPQLSCVLFRTTDT